MINTDNFIYASLSFVWQRNSSRETRLMGVKSRLDLLRGYCFAVVK